MRSLAKILILAGMGVVFAGGVAARAGCEAADGEWGWAAVFAGVGFVGFMFGVLS